jgi:hypothetical protein
MNKFITIIGAAALFSSFAHAGVITFENYTFTGSEPDETGRISRNGIASAWGSAKPFPGSIAGSYEYTTLTFNSGSTPELQISMTDLTGIQVFLSLYSGTFDPTNIATGYVGDAGSGMNLQVFQVDGTTNTNYTVVINEVPGGVQSGDVVNVCVEGFASAGSPAPTPACSNLNPSIVGTPEPATWATALCVLPMMALAALRLRNR